MRAEHKQLTRTEVTSRVLDQLEKRPAGVLHDVLADTLYHERMRLNGPRYQWESGDPAYWGKVAKRLDSANPTALRDLGKEVIARFVDDIMGSFDPRMYRAVTSTVPTALGLLLNSLDPVRALKDPKQALRLADNVAIHGETEAVRRLSQKGTVVVTPTHLSNLDSIVLGYTAYLVGLPPLTYGAGLNLFTNRLIGFFMNHLGAYRIDRRKKAELYKDVLKEYATYTMELGYHHLFFPGGTRSRSGSVERRLKKGLLGSALTAYQHNLESGKRQPNLYFVPCDISYGLVLEAETLIEDYLKDVGKSRYIIIDDEFSRLERIASFFRDMMALDSRIHITFGEPMDPFGNRVDFQGRSVDQRGRPVDITRYVMRDGKVVHDAQRDHEYTSELADHLVGSLARIARMQSTHVLAFAIHLLTRKKHPGADLYRVLKEGAGPTGFVLSDVLAAVERLLVGIRERAAAGRLGLAPDLEGKSADEVVGQALRYFASYHRNRAAWREGDRIQCDSQELAYYYHNRLTGYGLEDLV